MVLKFYKNSALSESLSETKDGFELWLPRNTVGQTVTEKFYIHNDSGHLVEGLTFSSNNQGLQFTANSRIAAHSTAEVLVSWKSDLFEALNSVFTVKAVEVANP